jgi:hypothetical protein
MPSKSASKPNTKPGKGPGVSLDYGFCCYNPWTLRAKVLIEKEDGLTCSSWVSGQINAHQPSLSSVLSLSAYLSRTQMQAQSLFRSEPIIEIFSILTTDEHSQVFNCEIPKIFNKTCNLITYLEKLGKGLGFTRPLEMPFRVHYMPQLQNICQTYCG